MPTSPATDPDGSPRSTAAPGKLRRLRSFRRQVQAGRVTRLGRECVTLSTATHSAYLSFRAGDADREVEQLRASLESRAGAQAACLGLGQASLAGHATALESLRASAVVLVVVGPRWADAASPAGGPALADPEDPVRQELLAAIERRLPMLVVLVRGARMVRAADLPPELTPIAQRPSVEIQAARWEFDVAALVELVKPLLGSRAVRASTSAGPRSAPVPFDVAAELRERASRLAPGAGGFGGAGTSPLVWALGVAALVLLAALAWWMMGTSRAPAVPDGPGAPGWPASATFASPLQAALDRLANAQADATVAAALASASARAADAAGRSAVPAGATADERARWQAEITRLRDDAAAAQRKASEQVARVATAQAAVDALRAPPPAVATPQRPTPTPPPPAARPPLPVAETSPAPSVAAPARPAVAATTAPVAASPNATSVVPPAPAAAPASPAADSTTLTLTNWAVSTSQGCGAGELRAVGNAQVTITRTSDGVLVSQSFQGAAGPWTLRTSGSATFPSARPSYEIESSGLWTREGARPFRSISRVTIIARDGGWVPATARGSQYRTECPGG